MSFRPPRFCICSGTWTVTVLLSAANGVDRVMQLLICDYRKLAHEALQSIDAKPEIDAGRSNIDALYQKPNDASLLRWEQLIPQGIELNQCFSDLSLGHIPILLLSLNPG